VVAAKIYNEQFGYTRIRRSLKEATMKILVTAVANVRKFNFNYYLQKNAPLPDNWSARKIELLKMAKDDVKRKLVYKELFENSNVTNSQVGNLLTEFVTHVLPN
jgi:telomerase reverse transcriptase